MATYMAGVLKVSNMICKLYSLILFQTHRPYLGHLLSVGLGIEGSLSEEDGVLLGGDTQLVVEGVVPDLLHVVPVGDDSVLDGVFQGKNTSLGLGLITDVRVLLSHSNHDTLMPGATDDRGEDGAGSVISGESGLAHTGAIVHNEGSNFVVTHLCFRWGLRFSK